MVTSVPRRRCLGIAAILLMCLGADGCAGSGNTPSSISKVAVTTSAPSATGASATPSNDANSAEKDVQITKCGNGSLANDAYMGADVEVTNHSTVTSSYMIEIAFDTPDGATQLDTGSAIVVKLDPGRSTQAGAASMKSPPPGRFTCKVASVDRSAVTP